LRGVSEQCREIACLSAVGLAVRGLWGGVFDVAATWFRNYWRSALGVYLVCACILVVSILFSGPLRWGGFSLVSAFLLTGMVQLIRQLRRMAEDMS
jgi:hypothetical protein